MRTVYSTLDVAHSLIVRIALKDAGIKFLVPNENASTWISAVGNPAVPVEFQVRDEDFDAAEKVIRETVDQIRETSRPKGGHKRKP
jgi:hypothetical protein